MLQDFIETVWHRQLEKALLVQPSYLELERGIPGWLGTTWEPYGLSLSWSVPCDLWGSVMSMHETCVCVCVCCVRVCACVSECVCVRVFVQVSVKKCKPRML